MLGVDGSCVDCSGGGGGGSGGASVYTPVPNTYVATNTVWQTIGHMPWLQSAYSTYTAGTAVYRADIVDRPLSIRVWNATAATSLGSDVAIAVSGTHSFALTSLPVADADIQIQIEKSAVGGTDPIVYSCVLEFVI